MLYDMLKAQGRVGKAPGNSDSDLLNPTHLDPTPLKPAHLNPTHLNPIHLNPSHLNPMSLSLIPESDSVTNPIRLTWTRLF